MCKRVVVFSTLLMALFIFVGMGVVYAGTCHVEFSIENCRQEEPVGLFIEPERPENSLLDQVTYAYLEDFTDVYPEPSFSSAPIRNVGEGFLYVTVKWPVINDAGELWYYINYGEYVSADSIRIVETSEFSGIYLSQQPKRPFGWVLVRVTPSTEPGGEPNEAFDALERYTFFQVYDAVAADDDWIWYQIGGGRWIRQTYVSLVDINPRPEGVGENEFWTEVDLYEQSFAAYEGDRMVYASVISSGLNRWPTREGLFQVWDRWEQTKMSGAEGRIDYYFIEDVPHTMYFDELMGIALHGAYWHDRFGYKHSHGCVNMPPIAAEWTFNWSKNAPNDLWVWVHTSNPHHYFDRFSSQKTEESDF